MFRCLADFLPKPPELRAVQTAGAAQLSLQAARHLARPGLARCVADIMADYRIATPGQHIAAK
jgi:hypothetical protein